MRCLCRHHRSRAGSPAKPRRLQPEALRMNSFEYIRPATISDAVAAATRSGAAYLASGTNLLDLMKGGIARPSRLVDITRLPGLDRVEHLAVRSSAMPIWRTIPISQHAIQQSPKRCCRGLR